MPSKSQVTNNKERSAKVEAPRADICLILETDMSLVASTCKAIAGIARPFLPIAQLGKFELALNEAITNAIEHGNLGISENEKLSLCENGGLEAERERRSVLARKDRKLVTVKAEFESEKVSVKIADEGKGFNWKKKRPDLPELNPSGRGLTIINSFFDEVIYNDKGNEQTLVKRTN